MEGEMNQDEEISRLRKDLEWVVHYVVSVIRRAREFADCPFSNCRAMGDLFEELSVLERSLPEYVQRTYGEMDVVPLENPHDKIPSDAELRALSEQIHRKLHPTEAPTFPLLQAAEVELPEEE